MDKSLVSCFLIHSVVSVSQTGQVMKQPKWNHRSQTQLCQSARACVCACVWVYHCGTWLTLPFSASLLARMHSTRLSSSLQDMVWMLHGNDSSWTFFEKRLTASARSLSDRLWRTWCTRSANVLYASGLPSHSNSKSTHTHLMALCLGLPRWAGTRKEKPNLDFTAARYCEWQWHQLGHKLVCTSVKTDNNPNTPPLSFYRLDALHAAQPTESKHWRHCLFYDHRHKSDKYLISNNVLANQAARKVSPVIIPKVAIAKWQITWVIIH